jgi:predicted Zn-dependent peptidase
MRSAAQRVLLASLGAFAAACSTPPDVAPPPAPAAKAPSIPQPAPAPRAAGSAAAAAAPARQSPLQGRLANGVTLSLLGAPASGEAELQLGLLGGSDFGAPGTAELAAATLVENGDVSQGRPSLVQAIHRLGGTTDVEVGPLSTWITLRVPMDRWQEAQRALAKALEAPSLSRSQLERMRDELVQQRVAAVTRDQVRATARSFLLGQEGTAQHIAALLDRDPSEVSLFQARLYRPDSAILALRVAGDPAKVTAAAADIGNWPAPAMPRALVPMQARRLPAGVHWAPGEPAAACRACLILPLPEVTRPDAADLFVLHACLTLDGIGGRLEQLQRERGLGQVRWQSQFVTCADQQALVLTVETTPDLAVELWQTAVAARASLRDVTPAASEVALARRRAALTAHLAGGNATARLRTQTLLAMRNLPADGLERRFEAIADAPALDLARAAEEYLKLPAAMVVFGGQPPAGWTDFTAFAALPAGMQPRLAAAGDQKAQTVAATPWLDDAIDAVGGAALLRRLDGFAAESTRQTENAPVATEKLRWSRSGDLNRTRTVLDNEIVTVLADASWTEQSGDKKITLSSREAALLRAESARHPLALLAACARGELQFKPVAQRTVGDRDLMILECLGTRFDRLRIHVDTMSHLVRVVELWETSADGTIVHLQEAWSDYRTTAGLRAPFRCIAEQDDGQNRVATVHSSWVPTLLAP